MKFDLKDKVAIVTGASQGIGETISVEMANSGAHVICLARNKDALDSTINIIDKNEKQAVAYPCDINLPASRECSIQSEPDIFYFQ